MLKALSVPNLTTKPPSRSNRILFYPALPMTNKTLQKILASLRLPLVATILGGACVFTAAAATPRTDESAFEMTIEENLATPAVPSKALNPLVRHIERIGNVYAKHGLEVQYARKRDVMKVIIPCSALFKPNSVTLSATAPKILSAFRDIVRLPQLYKVLVVVHTDDSGSDQYDDYITSTRADAIDAYFTKISGIENLNVIPYGVGYDEPLVASNSIVNRNRNRRAEIYIIPEKQLVEQAKSGKL